MLLYSTLPNMAVQQYCVSGLVINKSSDLETSLCLEHNWFVT